MKGKHHITIETKRLKYEFEIKRNITVIQGDSATGKTTLIELLSTYAVQKEKSGIKLVSDVECAVYTGGQTDWKASMESLKNSIIFIDEDYSFIFSEEFAKWLQGNSNYFVLITRRPIYNLPYSVNEIYGIRTSGKYHFPQQIYHEFYQIYSDIEMNSLESDYIVYLEDTKAGFQFYTKAFKDKTIRSCEGNANIAYAISESDRIIVIADGAAFGAYIDNLMAVVEEKKEVLIYLPESFEWLILKSGLIDGSRVQDILSKPEDYIDSESFLSWECFFTDLLQRETEDDKQKKYNKMKLSKFYYSPKAVMSILQVMPDAVREKLVN